MCGVCILLQPLLHIIRVFTNNNHGDNMQKFKKNAVFFIAGGLGYGAIELLWRGRTHWAMLVAGGICFVMFSHIAEKFKYRSLVFKAFLCAVGITAVEIVFGIVFNIILKENIWDYSGIPLNLYGQICPLYTVLWGLLSLVFIPVAERLNKSLNKK